MTTAHKDIFLIQRSGFQFDNDIVGRSNLWRGRFFIAEFLDPAMLVNADCFQKRLPMKPIVWLARYENRVKGNNGIARRGGSAQRRWPCH